MTDLMCGLRSKRASRITPRYSNVMEKVGRSQLGKLLFGLDDVLNNKSIHKDNAESF